MTDEYVVQKVLEGNTHIFSVIVDEYKDKIFNMVYRFTNDYNEAQDLSQEVFIKVFKTLHLFNEKSRFSTWIYRISYNLCIDWSRKNKKRLKQIYTGDEKGADIMENSVDIEQNYIEKQRQILIRDSINSLKEKYRTALILFHYQGLSYKEISDILKVSEKTVETRLYRARNLLKKSLAKCGCGGELYEVQAGS